MADNYSLLVNVLNEAGAIFTRVPTDAQISLIEHLVNRGAIPVDDGFGVMSEEIYTIGDKLRSAAALIETDDSLRTILGKYWLFDSYRPTVLIRSNFVSTLLYAQLVNLVPNRDAAVVVRELYNVATSETASVTATMLIGGMSVVAARDAVNGLRISPLSNSFEGTTSAFRNRNLKSLAFYIGTQYPTAVMTRDIEVVSRFVNAIPPEYPIVESALVDDEVFTYPLEMFILEGAPAYRVIQYVQSPIGSPVLSLTVLPYSRPKVIPVTLGHQSLEQWSNNLASMEKLNGDQRLRIRMVIHRLHQALLEFLSDPADTCIDLRVAMELCFTTEGALLRAIAHRLSLRIPQFINPMTGRSDASSERVKQVYKVLSEPIHGNGIKDSQEFRDAIEDAHMYCVAGVKRFLRDGGIPEWRKFDVTATN